MDQAFLPRHYATTPRSVYYHSMLALSDVVSGGAPFLALTPAAYALLHTRRRLGRAPQWKYLIWAPVLAARILAGDHAVFIV